MQVSVTETYTPQSTYNFQPSEVITWVKQLPKDATLALVDHSIRATWTKEI